MTLLSLVRAESISISVAATAIFLLYRFIIYPLFLSPLARIPNAHWSSPLSPVWILYVRFIRRENAILHEAHRRLGPVVRLGPNDLSINDIDAVRTIYGGGFDKTHWYSVFDNYGFQCMFSALPSRDHSIRKRMISNVYSKSSIHNSAPLRAQARTILHDRLLPTLRAASHANQAPHGIDVHSLFAAAAMDFITAYLFGLRCGSDFIRGHGYREHWLHLYKARSDYGFFPQELPLLTRVLRCIPLCSPYPRWVDLANQELGRWNEQMCDEAMGFSDPDRDGGVAVSVADEPVVLRALEAGLRREKASKGDEVIETMSSRKDYTVHSELFDHVLAGQETTGIALDYITWHLSKSPDAQRELQNELRTLSPGIRTRSGANDDDLAAPGPKALDALPILHAVIMETLRLHAPIPGAQPRVTPGPGCQLGGFAVPGGVRVAALAHTLHRDESVFPEPEEWEYTRWMVNRDEKGGSGGSGLKDEARRVRDRQFWAFSSGGRMCIGSNLAMYEMKLIVAAIYSNFTTHIVDDEGMEQGDGYTVGPVSGRLYLRFEELE